MIYRASIFLASTILFLSNIGSGVALGEDVGGGSVVDRQFDAAEDAQNPGAGVPTVAGVAPGEAINIFHLISHLTSIFFPDLPRTNEQAGADGKNPKLDTWVDLKGGTVTGTEQTESTETTTVDIFDWGGYKIGQEQRDVSTTTEQPFKAENAKAHFNQGSLLRNGTAIGIITVKSKVIPATFEVVKR